MIEKGKYKFGLIGLGTMGCNLLLNIADLGFSAAGYHKGEDKVSQLNKFGHASVKGFNDIKVFIQSLEIPYSLMMLHWFALPIEDKKK